MSGAAGGLAAVLLTATIMSVGAGGASAAGPLPARVGPNARIGASTAVVRGPGVPGLAVDPANPRHVVEVDEDFISGNCQYHASFDGGVTWSGGSIPGPAGFPSPPCHQFDIGGYAHSGATVAFGAGQDVYTTFSSQMGQNDQSVLVSKSTDGGRTFAPAVVAMPGPADGRVVYQRPELTATGSGSGERVYVDAWVGSVLGSSGGFGSSTSKIPGCGQPCGFQIAVSSSSDGGATWSAPVTTTAQTAPAQPADAAPIGIAREQSQPAVAANGDVYVAWRSLVSVKPDLDYLVVGKSTDGGATWTRTVVGGTANQVPALRLPKLAVGPGNSVYVAYQAKPNGVADIRVVGSTDGGSTWSPPVAVVDQAAAGKAGVPQVAVAPDGRVDVVWYDTRNSGGPDNLADVYESWSTDGARTFSPDRRVTDRSINFDTGLYNRILTLSFYTPAVANIGDGADMVAWSDSRQGSFTTDSQDIYRAIVDFAPAGGLPARALATKPASSPTASEVSIGLSNLAWPGGSEAVGGKTRRSATKVVVVGQDDPASALVGAVLARANFGPVLVSAPSGLSPALRHEISRLQPSGAYVVGGRASLGAGVIRDLAAAGVPAAATTRLAGASAAATAAAVANALDTRSAADKAKGAPAAAAALVVNPSSPDPEAAAAWAAAEGFPVLFAGPASLPPDTSAALRTLAIGKTFVLGGTDSVPASVLGQLPGATRLAGASAEAVSAAADAQARHDGVPGNVVYQVAPSDQMGAAVAGAAVARLGGLVVVASGPAAASSALGRAGVAAADRIVTVPSPAGAGGVSTVLIVLIVLAAVLVVAGIALLVAARRRAWVSV